MTREIVNSLKESAESEAASQAETSTTDQIERVTEITQHMEEQIEILRSLDRDIPQHLAANIQPLVQELSASAQKTAEAHTVLQGYVKSLRDHREHATNAEKNTEAAVKNARSAARAARKAQQELRETHYRLLWQVALVAAGTGALSTSAGWLLLINAI